MDIVKPENESSAAVSGARWARAARCRGSDGRGLVRRVAVVGAVLDWNSVASWSASARVNR